MRQFIGMIGDEHHAAADLALSLAAPGAAGGRRAARRRPSGDAAAERRQVQHRDEKAQLRYADALAAWGEAGGYDAEVLFDTVADRRRSACPGTTARDRPVRTLSGGQQKRFALELLLRGADEVLLLDEPDNFLDVPAQALAGGAAARVRQVGALRLARPGAAGPDRDRVVDRRGRHRRGCTRAASRPGTRRGGPATTASRSCAGAGTRSTQKLATLMLMYKQKAAYNDGMASRYQAAQTRLRKFEEAGPPPAAAARSRTSGCG